MTDISFAKFIDYDAAKYNYFTAVTFRDDIVALSELMASHVWSPCIWTNKRKKENFRYADLAAFDFDDGVWTIDDAVDWVGNIAGLWAIIGTTRSHQLQKGDKPPCDRFRLVLKWSRRIKDRRTYEQNMQRLVRAMPADHAVVDAGRLLFPCREIVHIQDGRGVDIVPFKDFSKCQRKSKYATRDDVPPWMNQELERGITQGTRNRTVFRFALHLKDRGHTVESARDVLSAIDLSVNELTHTIQSAFNYTLHGAPAK